MFISQCYPSLILTTHFFKNHVTFSLVFHVAATQQVSPLKPCRNLCALSKLRQAPAILYSFTTLTVLSDLYTTMLLGFRHLFHFIHRVSRASCTYHSNSNNMPATFIVTKYYSITGIHRPSTSIPYHLQIYS
jgi:hypothetical protein